ncbi:PP2C family protein-serine/threonine phosphatase [Pseudoxanthomonas suwonensis]|uniref:PP2C family protein-serine/threonine phosphatase n=1 Tax=Pseudoxanthomonas suwonensis TaxID=314722 RepID=UPI00130E1B73|nr:PP2C family serine/threonine-protein phosphatase [Pseudoxanthomonas suwonensis]
MDSDPASLLLQVQDWLLRRVPPSGVRRVLPVLAALGSDVGVIRKENQDRVALVRGRDDLGHTYVVVALSDGIGGMRDGAQCAALTVSAVFDAVHRLASSGEPPSKWATNAMNSANEAVRKAYGGAGGATLVLLLMTEKEGAYWASVGDSRLYLSKGESLVQISTDDTIAGQLGRPAGSDIEQGKLLQYIGMEGPLEFEVAKLLCSTDDTAILTTDGVHFLDSDSDVMSLVVRHAPDIGVAARRLTELARWAGGPDNATAAVVSLDSALYESPPTYACLDIWDPFGEIRIPLVHRDNQQVMASGAVSKRPQVAESEVSIKDDAVTQPVVEDEDVPPKKKGGKSKPKKRKPRAPRSGSAPQVQLEFSNKKS